MKAKIVTAIRSRLTPTWTLNPYHRKIGHSIAIRLKGPHRCNGARAHHLPCQHVDLQPAFRMLLQGFGLGIRPAPVPLASTPLQASPVVFRAASASARIVRQLPMFCLGHMTPRHPDLVPGFLLCGHLQST